VNASGVSAGSVNCSTPVAAAPAVPAPPPASAPMAAPFPPPAIAPIAAPSPAPPPMKSAFRFLCAGPTRSTPLVRRRNSRPPTWKESSVSAITGRPLSRPDCAACVRCPWKRVPDGITVSPRTTTGRESVAVKPSPARFFLVLTVSSRRTRSAIPDGIVTARRAGATGSASGSERSAAAGAGAGVGAGAGAGAGAVAARGAPMGGVFCAAVAGGGCFEQPAASTRGAIQIHLRNCVIVSTSPEYCTKGANYPKVSARA
jgi:hypothetical protein